MPPENKPGVEEIIDEAAKAAEAAKTEADAKAKKEADAKASAASGGETKKDQPAGKSLDELMRDPKIRDQIKSVRGWNDSQLDSAYMQAPLQEKVARYEIKDKYKDFDEHREFIDKELQNVAIFDRTPQVMERLYWMAKGKSGIENPKKETPKDSTVVRERIYSPFPSSATGGGEGGGGKVSTLSDEEKFVADQLGVPYDKYEASKKGHRPDRADSKKYIRPPEPYKAPQGGNSADQALGVLLKPRR